MIKKTLLVVATLAMAMPLSYADEKARLAELDAYWAEVSRCVREGHFKGYAATVHPDGVLVSGTRRKSYPLADALKRWKAEFDATKAGTRPSSAEFRFHQRYGDGTTAHETGILLYKAQPKGQKPIEEYVDFEALLLKRGGKWLIVMEYQKAPTTKAAWEKLKPALPKAGLPFPGETLTVAGRQAFVILPGKREAGKPTPWVWYAPTLRGLPGKQEAWMFERFLAKGIAVAGIDVGESYGSPAGREAFTQLYKTLTTQWGLAPRPCLLARSRGGLMLYNWAVENPSKVSGVAGVYPVCSITSYPGIKRACGAYGMTPAELEEKLAQHNPIERLAPLAKAGVPILHLHGDNDRVVPHDKNSAIVAERYKALGGEARMIVIPGGGHDLKPHWFTSKELTDFAVERALAGAEPRD